ncbi:MAG: phosphatidylglycerol lysyltransferase domain-containing protein [Ruminococcus sp.]|jgi:hypothetical protein|nr:phosphatidylglycerol lysyltransferase domain-containing protein [Ruminococcus sp.]
MLEFHELTIEEKSRADKALRASDFRGCEYSFSNNLAWRRAADSKIAFYKDFYICAATNPEFSCINPAGEGDRKEVITLLRKHAENLGQPLYLGGVTEEQFSFFEECFPGEYTVETNEDYYDYVYNTADFQNFPGKKYHGKRNHLSRFKTMFNYECTDITERDFDDCIVFAAQKFDDKEDSSTEDTSSAVVEQFAIDTYFNEYYNLGLFGKIIRIDGKIAAFSVGDKLNSDTVDVHIEKADTSFHGAYTAIANLFSQGITETYLNREEDLGIEGLRKSKQSYYPVFQIKKYRLTFK